MNHVGSLEVLIHKRTIFLLGSLLVLLLVIVIVGLFLRQRGITHPMVGATISLAQDVDGFFREYWKTPIPSQGPAPTTFSEKEASLKPESCGSCHPDQYRDWKESLHSRTMGPGPWGQIIDLTQSSPDQATLCLTCHAPLSEQMPSLARTGAPGGGSYTKNPNFDSQLQLQGIVCAACHVRQHQRFGPLKAEKGAAQYSSGMPNHGGVQRTPHFEKAEFCRGCHQFDPDNTLLVNGKPLQDTYREWKNSLWGKGEAACQECHMPGRRHLWKGIHDPKMVKGGVRVEAQIKGSRKKPGEGIEVEIKVTNAAVGHKFPSYITPKVFIRANLVGKSGQALPGTQQEVVIGWDVRAEGGQWVEFFDTRVSPGETFQHSFKWDSPKKAQGIRTWVEVHPDYFYHVHFYPAYLSSGQLSREGRRLVEKAREESGRSTYILFEKNLPLNGAH